jgi:hypothetical protein
VERANPFFKALSVLTELIGRPKNEFFRFFNAGTFIRNGKSPHIHIRSCGLASGNHETFEHDPAGAPVLYRM